MVCTLISVGNGNNCTHKLISASVDILQLQLPLERRTAYSPAEPPETLLTNDKTKLAKFRHKNQPKWPSAAEQIAPKLSG